MSDSQTARLASVTMSRRDMLPTGIRITITGVGEQAFNVSVTVKTTLAETVRILTSGQMVRFPDDISNDYVRLSFSITAPSYEDAIREMRELYGSHFALEEPLYEYEILVPKNEHSSPFFPVISICDLVPGSHNYLRITTPDGYATNLARTINAAQAAGKIPALEQKAVADTEGDSVVHLTLVSGDNHLATYLAIASLMKF